MTKAVIHSLPSGSKVAQRLALRLGIPAHRIEVHRFPDGEIRVTVGPSAHTVILYVSLDQPNEKLLAILFAAEALRRDGAKRIVLVSPYLCYMRQDAVFHRGEAISQHVLCALLAKTVNRIITVDAHLHRTPDIQTAFHGIEADNLTAMPAIAAAIRSPELNSRTVIVGPDAESRQWVASLAIRLGLPYVVAEKMRRGDRSVEVRFEEPTALLNKFVILVDDIVSSGGTLSACARAAKTAGAASIEAIVTHALFPPALAHNFLRAGITLIRSTDSIPHPSNAISLDDTLVAALSAEVQRPASSS